MIRATGFSGRCPQRRPGAVPAHPGPDANTPIRTIVTRSPTKVIDQRAAIATGCGVVPVRASRARSVDLSHAAPSTGQWPFEALHEFGTPADRWVSDSAPWCERPTSLWHVQRLNTVAHSAGERFTRSRSTGQVSTVYAFSGADGALPAAGLVLGNDGFLYGTTVSGGAGYGTVFRFNYVSRVLEVIHAFQGNNSGDGEGPYAVSCLLPSAATSMASHSLVAG